MGKVIRVIDADTLRVDLFIAPGLTWRTSVRLIGIDTPEKGGRAKCGKERELARAAKVFTLDFVGGVGASIEVTKIKYGKYAGRVLGDVLRRGRSLTTALLDAGHGREYHGGKRKGWCE
jgi:endonuclease YncB( thermonuclease family)